jgi:hypothetical protein
MSNPNWPYDEETQDPADVRAEIEATIEEVDTPEERATARRAGRHAVLAWRAALAGDHDEAKRQMKEVDRILPMPE